ncbi:MAG TPA: hypothetical protein DCZ75_03090 [Geobacter sp.]|nr:hypothetical protein [Geobacter sp.]
MNIRLAAFSLLANLVVAAVATAAPELSVGKGTYNFGTVTQGKKVTHVFTIKNGGDQPLQIKKLEAACGCTAVKPSTSVVQPGRSAEIEVIFDSSAFSGKVQKTVTMTTNAGKTPTYTFAMEGSVTEELQVIPRQLSLGSLASGVAKQVTVIVTNNGGNSVKILAVNVNSNSLQMKPTIRKGELKPGESGTIEVAVTPRPEAKVLSGYLHIVTNHPQKKELTVPVYGSIAK